MYLARTACQIVFCFLFLCFFFRYKIENLLFTRKNSMIFKIVSLSRSPTLDLQFPSNCK